MKIWIVIERQYDYYTEQPEIQRIFAFKNEKEAQRVADNLSEYVHEVELK